MAIGKMTCVLSMFDLHRFLRCSLILSVQFSSRHLPGNNCIHGSILDPYYLLIATKQVGLICYCIFISGFLVLCRNLSFCFCLVNSDCDASLAVDNSLVYSYSKMILLFFSLVFSLV